MIDKLKSNENISVIEARAGEIISNIISLYPLISKEFLKKVFTPHPNSGVIPFLRDGVDIVTLLKVIDIKHFNRFNVELLEELLSNGSSDFIATVKSILSTHGIDYNKVTIENDTKLVKGDSVYIDGYFDDAFTKSGRVIRLRNVVVKGDSVRKKFDVLILNLDDKCNINFEKGKRLIIKAKFAKLQEDHDITTILNVTSHEILKLINAGFYARRD